MSSEELLNWSADLRRISFWLQTGNTNLAQKFITLGRQRYSKGATLAGRQWQWWWKEISNPNILHSAERALTWSILINNQLSKSSVTDNSQA